MSRERLDWLKRDAFRILDDARREHFAEHDMAACVVMFSGGNDSTVLAHLMREHCTHFGHSNTGIGVEQTREYVRTVAAAWNIPLVEHGPDEQDSYRSSVLAYGFPGPGHHFRMYQRLKERAFRKIRDEFVSDPYRERVMFLGGIRKDESKRRANRDEHHRDGSIVWVSPIINWTDDDMRTYRDANPDLPRNEVSDMLHMSGECLCGAYAERGELDQIRFWFPDVAEHIDELAAEARAAGVDEQRCRWGWGAYRDWDPNQLALFAADLEGTTCEACPTRFGSDVTS